MAMTRLRIDLAYDGGGFYGWAKQPNLRTVQGTIEDALHKVLRVPADDAAEPTPVCTPPTKWRIWMYPMRY